MNGDGRIIALVRADGEEAAVRRLSRIWWDWPELRESIGNRVEVVRGDVREDRLGLGGMKYEDITAKVTHIIHTAADLRLGAPMEELRTTNVQGVANVLRLAETTHKDHGLVRYSHVSTAYVAGGRTGQVPEEALTEKYGFLSNYERSKYEGELIVEAARRELPVSVFRPGIVVGDSKTGFAKTFNVLYYPLRFYLKLRPRIIPISGSLRVNLVPVDYVANAVADLTHDPRAEGLNFHLTAPHDLLPTVREFVDFVRDWAGKRLDLKFPRPFCLPLALGSRRGRASDGTGRGKVGILDEFSAIASYFHERRQFMRENVDRLLGPYQMDWREFMPIILEYAVYMGFMHRSERTVHEQILFRLDSKSRPVKYHDIVEGAVVDRDAAEIKKNILGATASLQAMGVRPGDRIALVGLNSTRYLAMDIAIGLVGAVSVPLYYTCPPSDVEGILEDCKAKMFLVGAPRLLDRMKDLPADIPVVSFCRGPVPERFARKVIGWEAFLDLGRGGASVKTAPIGFGDVATIRYTSSTTGKPKGVVFKHEGLRWMAESLASLPPWNARNSLVTYLSFLPMNHVVEGLLGTYSPYYAPAPLDIWFQENFRDLQRSLPLARPTIFFSVPRFYEKVLEGLQENNSYRRFKAMRAGIRKGILGGIIRRAVLKRVGLDRSAQLIVGSAPCSDDLLRDFRDLGIEVHNAYGLTEAPLVTLNRLGRNRIGTVGEPLLE
ncbi:MAG: SDR family oxidoreductase, partial [Methanomassiliicoccales archaeon]|nr:SDR family oxidoreductase [Methanomassiliicoccales archaeon]